MQLPGRHADNQLMELWANIIPYSIVIGDRYFLKINNNWIKGSFTYYVISRGEGGGFQMLTVDYGGGGGGGGWPLIT